MSTYHERVALAMSRTYSAGSMNSYETILAALKTKFPKEEALRAYVGFLEQVARSSGTVRPDWTLTDEQQ